MINKFQKNKKIKKESGFVILFAVTLAAILLSVALGVANIAQKEIRFSTSARDTNDSFVAADTGAECALFYDKLVGSSFPADGSSTTINCAGASVPVTYSNTAGVSTYSFNVTGLGSTGNSCSKVAVTKDTNTTPYTVTVTSTGYNIGDSSCASTNSNRVERQLKVSSLQSAPAAGGGDSSCTATGGTITTSGAYTVHTFTSSGTFTVTSGSCSVDYLVVAGGGGGGAAYGGGGGGGGVRTGTTAVTAQGYTVTVGGGGNGAPAANTANVGSNGGNSVFGSTTATGGGGGAGYLPQNGPGAGGGSGGGGVYGGVGGSGTSGQGSTGGTSVGVGGTYAGGGGGGGASAVGGNASTSGTAASTVGGNGGAGLASSISGSSVTYGGGGGGGTYGAGTGGTGGTGGGGGGASGSGNNPGNSGTANRGGGGGGSGYLSSTAAGGNGGSGIVIVRYLTPASNPIARGTNGGVAWGTTKTWTQATGANDNLMLVFVRSDASTVSGVTNSDGAMTQLTGSPFSIPSACGSSCNYYAFYAKNPTKSITHTITVTTAGANISGTSETYAYVDTASFPLASTAVTLSGNVSAALSLRSNSWSVLFAADRSGTNPTANTNVTALTTLGGGASMTLFDSNGAQPAGTFTQTANASGSSGGFMIEVPGTGGSGGGGNTLDNSTGGTITIAGGYRIHTFTSSGSFTASGSGNVDYLVVAGGASGGTWAAGGGGAGGFRTGSLAVTAQPYTVTVGTGGVSQTTIGAQGHNGQNSVFGSITSTGGGGGGGYPNYPGLAGGSGGGGGYQYASGGTGIGGQGHNGGIGNNGAGAGGGGGGASAAGTAGNDNGTPGTGGAGLASSLSGSSVTYARGGNGKLDYSGAGAAGAANTGNGGEGGGYSSVSGAGGSGIVIIRYAYP